MSTKLGHFEIISELAKSPTSTVYKANDAESGQTVALKAIQLAAFGDVAGELEKSLLQEVESTKPLSSSNITPLLGAGEIEGQFCAAMEYVQGNSVATMLERKEGFSIWDLLDIGRQICGAFEHAHGAGVFHYSLEPSKIMCGWDGTVKVLGFGVSTVGKYVPQIPGPVPSILHYMSPEQIRGEALDVRSNLFSLGAIFYEMVSDRKAFDREQIDGLKEAILESTPVPPMHANPKVSPGLSDLIMKALEKDPAQRYQRARDLLNDLEKCKDSKPQAGKKPAGGAKAGATASGATDKPAAMPASTSAGAGAKGANNQAAQQLAPKKTGQLAGTTAPRKAAAAAAGASGSGSRSQVAAEPAGQSRRGVDAQASTPSSSLCSAPPAVDEPELETFAAEGPKVTVDPLMAEGGSARAGTSFSDISELPPLKEVYVAPEPPPPPPSTVMETPSVTRFPGRAAAETKPKIQPREAAQKAIKEIRGVPPRLMLYSIAGAVGLILVVIVGLVIHYYNATGDDDTGSARPAAVQTQPVTSTREPAHSAPAATPAPPPVETAPAAPEVTTRTIKEKSAKRRSATAAAPVVVPGQISVDSTPAGAQIQIDGQTDSSWVAPATIPGLQPGKHTVTLSKSGYVSDTRTVDVSAGGRSSIVAHLAQMMAILSAKSDPAGAAIYVDGRDMGKVTPAQVNVDKGQHVVLLRKAGYLDETTSAQFTLGQTISFSQSLRPLGSVENMKIGGKMKKLFGGGQGMASVSIHTQPKGAQIAINQHMVEKTSPVEVMLDPGNYQIDITLSGYAPVHKVVTIEKGSKVAVDEALHPE